MRRPTWKATFRSAAVLTLGALGLHQLSYLLAHGDGAGAALAAHGHGYLSTVAPIAVTTALAVVAATLAAAALSSRAQPKRPPCPELRAAALAVALLAIFAVQELFEGLLAAGHPQGIEALLEVGWVALPLAFPIGALAAVALGGLERAELLLASAMSPRRLPRGPRDSRLTGSRSERGPVLARQGLRFGLARRGPPANAHS